MGVLFLHLFKPGKALGFSFFQHSRGRRRDHRECHDEGGHQAVTDAQGHGHHQAAHNAGREHHRQEHAHRGEGGGDDGHAYLLCALHGGAGCRDPPAAQAVDVLDDHHRVVHQHADADERGNCRGDIQRAATPGRGDQTGEVGDQVVFVLVLVEVQDAVVGCSLLLERDLDLVDIEDIKEFSILKDAAATAVYGVRGANGVVLVTTRGGIVGKPQINIKFEAGMVQPTKIPDMIDAVQFAEMYNAAAGYDFYSKKDIQMFRDGSDPDLHPNIDWVDRLYKDYSFNQRVNVNISGGGSTAKYYISGGFYNEDGLFKADNMKEYNTSAFYRRFNFRSNVEVQLHKYTKLNINLATTFERKNEPGSSATGANGIWGYALKTAANAFPDVYSNGYLAGPASGQGENPYALLTQTGYREIFYNTAQSLFVLTQDLGDWVTTVSYTHLTLPTNSRV